MRIRMIWRMPVPASRPVTRLALLPSAPRDTVRGVSKVRHYRLARLQPAAQGRRAPSGPGPEGERSRT